MTAVVEQVELVDLRAKTRPGDHSFFVGVRADGRRGWCGPVAASVARVVAEALADAVLGAPVADRWTLIDRLRTKARHSRASTDRRTAPWAIGVLDCALWDLHGHLTGQPVAGLLSQHLVDSVAAYASWLTFDLTAPSAGEEITRVARDGWQFTKWGLRSVPGSGSGSETSDLHTIAMRVAQWADGLAAFDAVSTWDTALARDFARTDLTWLLWLEDPLPNEFDGNYRRLGSAGLPLALGEHVLVDDEPDDLFTLSGLRAFTVDVIGCDGLTQAVDLISVARAHRIDVVPHGRSLIPALHLAATHPDIGPCVEYQVPSEPRRQSLYAQPRAPKHGRIMVGQAPGLGLAPRRSSAR